jgi:CheY-like chemotaxis protein
MKTQDNTHQASGTRVAADVRKASTRTGGESTPAWSISAKETAGCDEAGSYVGKTGADPKTVGLLITATEYAVAAIHRIIQQSAGSPDTLDAVLQQYVDLVFGLEVNFVFPNLTGHERELLVSLMKVRNALGVQMSGLPQWRTPAQKLDHDRLAAELKSQFASLCLQIRESNLEDRLDSVQQTVLKEEFLSILLDREDNTKLFFRKRSPTAEGAKSNTAQLDREPPHAEPLNTTHTDRLVGHGKKILIIDRSEHEAHRIAGWLTQSGYEAVVGIPGFESCRQAAREKPDLILLEFTGSSCDWPSDTVLDGQTTFKVLAQIPKAQGTPVLGMASEDKQAIRDEALQTGALACLCKPLDRDRLLKAIRVTLDDPEPNSCPASAPAA